MPRLQEVQIGPRPIELLLQLAGEDRVRETSGVVEEMRRRMDGRVLWNLNSTGAGGGVAEMLRLAPTGKEAGQWGILVAKGWRGKSAVSPIR